ncbi:MAG: hypothetical protein N2Z73_02050, partial [Endomicrobia bacterium]|nr:hypothetical protein [Endomicrobiia bacterium]
MNLGVSTIYFSKDIIKKAITWKEIKNNIYQLGINSVELNADIPTEWMNEIEKDVNNNTIKILSMHNFCPAVEYIPKGKFGFNVYTLNSVNKEERTLALKYTLRTIDLSLIHI